jgi:hypothetical protein
MQRNGEIFFVKVSSCEVMPEKQLKNTKGEMTTVLCKRLKGPPQEMAFPFENVLSAFRRQKRLR